MFFPVDAAQIISLLHLEVRVAVDDLHGGASLDGDACDAGNPLSTEQIDDPYRRGIIAVHDAEIAAELDWLRSMLGVENESVTE